jgi:hypothetical protein
VLVVLLLLAVAQGLAVQRASALPGDVRLVALKEGFGDRTDGDVATVGFQLRNTGRAVEVLAVGRDGPGLELVDVFASGEPVGFRAAGEGAALLPRFHLAPDAVVVLTLAYRVRDCDLVPRRPFPVTLLLRVGDAQDVVEVPLPTYHSERPGAGPDEEQQWQTALVQDLCGRA